MSQTAELILAVPGPEQMKALPKYLIREALKTGEIEPSRLVWSEELEEWKPLEEVPHLLFEDEEDAIPEETFSANIPEENSVAMPVVVKAAATITSAAVAVVAKPVVANAVTKPVATVAVAKAVPIRMAAAIPTEQTVSASAPVAGLKAFKKTRIQREEGGSILRWLAIGSFLVLCGILGANYYFVEMPFQQKITAGGLAGDAAYAHFGGFYQQDVLVIHIMPGKGITRDNFLKSLVILANSSPLPPGKTSPFPAISLTPGWDTLYLIQGAQWSKLANLGTKASDDQKIALLLSGIQVSGKLLLEVDVHAKDVNNADFTLDDKEKRAWDLFVSSFVAS